VVPDDSDLGVGVLTKFCQKFIEYAKSLGADAVSFRKVASNVEPTRAEKFFAKHYGVDSETQCPVCRGMNQIVDGYDVRWKGTVNEPSLDTNGIYEVIIHPDGNGYVDWGMTKPVSTEMLEYAAKKFHAFAAVEDDDDEDVLPKKPIGSTLLNPIAMHEHIKTLAERSISKPKRKKSPAYFNFTGAGYSGGCGSGGCGGGRSGCGGGC
jgi:hypothetical protein